MKFNKEIKVGALAIGAIVILLLGVNYLKGINLFNKGADYYVEYSHIPGLMKGDAIQINGYPIGRVKDIGIADVHSGIIFVVLNITEPIKVPSDSRATIRSADLLGEKFIALKLGASEVYLNPGDTIAGDIESDITNQIREELRPLTEKVQSMIVSVDTAITVMSSIFTPTFKDDFGTSISNIKQTLETFNDAAKRMDALLKRQEPQIESIISGISDNIENNESELHNIISNLSIITDSLATINWGAFSDNLDSTIISLNNVIQKIDASEGTLGKLVNDEELYNNLLKISENLDRITLEIEANPKKYLPPIIQIGGKSKSDEK